ncbi:hypothetical protein BGZ94_008756 [Podila epigama]|nr:hypothetical protein BGZ94_008756 [Podila epigama]
MKTPSILLLATLATLLVVVEAAPLARPLGIENNLARPDLFKRQNPPNVPDPPTREPAEPTSSAKPKPPAPTSHPPAPAPAPEPTSARPNPSPPSPPPATSSQPQPPSQPQPQPQPKPTPAPQQPQQPNPPPSPSKHTSSSSSSHGHGSSGASSPTSAAAGPVTSPTDSDDEGMNPNGGDSSVPTKVSEKVFIGLGTVGGMLVFALGGIAFCRHRRKKNLATALLEQTAQFNNNNPYAKLDEPMMMSAKESLPMTPTKPLGTFPVVATYTPALADEIEIGLGDSVTILQEFDDGWCLGINNTRGRIKGVFPGHCVDMGQFGYDGQQQQNQGHDGQYMANPNPSFKAQASKRMSSMAPPQGWNSIGYYGQNGGGYEHYPPHPSPSYHGHGGGGYYNNNGQGQHGY